MLRTDFWARATGILIVSAIVGGPGEAGAQVAGGPASCPPGSSGIVYRPAYAIPGTKPLYLNTYAANYYPPLGSGRVARPTSGRLRSRWLFGANRGAGGP